VVTSPPYHLLRRYGGGPQELGTEPTVTAYVERLVEVTDEVGRVLKPGGSLWLNLGDSYSRHGRYGASPKSLLLAPERLLLALNARGWVVRNKVVWAKTTCMPSSVSDRLNCTWEPLFLLVRSRHYYFDLDAIRRPHRSPRRPAGRPTRTKHASTKPAWAGPLAGKNDGLLRLRISGRSGHELGKNPGDVWQLSPARFDGKHFAVFPETLVSDPIKATCPAQVCDRCGHPWQREPRRDRLGELRSGCACRAGWRPGLVLDPFMGAGTVAVVAERLGRDWLGVELNPAFAKLAGQRITAARADQQQRQSAA
jgi:DNA modification methylase